MTKQTDERKVCRFPMFDDQTGVKQIPEYTRVILQEEYPMKLTDLDRKYTAELLTDEDYAELEYDADYQVAPDVFKEEPRVNYQDSFSDYELEDEIEFNYHQELYQDNVAVQEDVEFEPIKPNFTPAHQPIFDKGDESDDERIKPVYEPVARDFLSDVKVESERETSLNHRFTPKPIPESRNRSFAAIAKDQEEKNKILKRFKKERESYLLMEDGEEETQAYGKTEIVSTPQKPNFKREDADIPFTRREFKKLSDKEKEKVELPSEAQEKEQRRTNRLDRGLSGIFEEESGRETITRYFD